MPSVPKYSLPEVRNRQQIVTATADLTAGKYSSVDGITASAFGTDITPVGNALNRAGDVMSDIAIKQRIEDNERKAKELDIEFTRRKNSILYGDGTDQNPGYYSLKGGAAVDNAATVQEQLEALRREMADNATNQRVREMFEISAAQRLTTDLNKISQYVVGERRTASLATSQARLETAVGDAARGYTDLDVVRQSKAIIRSEVIGQGEIEGHSPEVIQNNLQNAYNVLYSQMIRGALSNRDVQGARTLLEENRSQMDPAIAAQLEAQLKVPLMVAQAQQATDEYMISGMTASEMIADARSKFADNPELRDEIVSRLKVRNAEAVAQREAQFKATSDSWHSAVITGAATLDDLMTTDPDGWAFLATNPTTVKSLKAAEKARRTGETFAETSDPALLNQLATMDRRTLSAVDPATIQSLLTPSDYASWVTRIRASKQALENETASFEAYSRAESLLRRMAPELNIGKSDQSKKEEEIANTILHEMDAFIAQHVEANGQNPSLPEIRDRLTSLLTPVEVPTEGSWLSDIYEFIGGNSNEQFKTYAEAMAKLTPQELANVTVDLDEVPTSWVKSAREQFNLYEIDPTDEMLADYIAATIAGQGDRQDRLLGITSRNRTSPMTELQTRREPVPRTGTDPFSINSTTDLLGQEPNMNFNQLLDTIIDHEGFENRVYTDTVGVPTIGVGFNLDRSDAKAKIEALGLNYEAVKEGTVALTDDQVRTLLADDARTAISDARSLVPNFDRLSANRKLAITDLAFNLGRTRLAGFKKALKAFNEGDFNKAADEFKDSLWYKQVKRRGPLIVDMIRKG